MIQLLRSIKKIQKKLVSGFVCDYIDRLYYNCHKVTLNEGDLCMKSKNWSKKKKQQ